MEIKETSRWVKIGDVAVDSGNLLLTDPAYVEEGDRDLPLYEELVGLKPSSRVLLTLEDSKKPAQETIDAFTKQVYTEGTSSQRVPLAVVTHTGRGDGSYPVHARIVEAPGLGEAVAEVKVVFIKEGEWESIARDPMSPEEKQIRELIAKEKRERQRHNQERKKAPVQDGHP